MQKKKKAKKENSERWLLTYSDLITLLMILFILLFAMSNISQEKYEKLSASLGDSLGNGTTVYDSSPGILPGQNGGNSIIDGEQGNNQQQPEDTSKEAKPTVTPTPKVTQAPDNNSDSTDKISSEKDMENLQSNVDDILSDLGINKYVGTEIKDSGMYITFSNDVFFDSGDDSLKPGMLEGLKNIAPLLNKMDNTIVVEGHTDNVPMNNNSKFSSNWQLSSARAANVVQYLVEKCKVNGTRISAIGYGEYHPKASNKTEQGRTKNRRIDIVILYDENKSEK